MKRVFSWLWLRWGKQAELWLHRHGHWFGAIAFLAALIFASLWLWQAREMDVSDTAMLTHQREPVPGKYPSLDALILSQVDDSATAHESHPSKQVIEVAGKIVRALNESGKSSTVVPQARIPSVRPTLHVTEVPTLSPSVADQAIVDDSKIAALFIPAFSLPLDPSQRQGFKTGEEVRAAIKRNPQLANDITASAVVASFLPSFGSQPLFEEAKKERLVTQAYFITQTGVTRMWQKNATADATRDNFNPHRIFQDRPYFWPTLEHSTQELSEYSYLSVPYFDVAGNGIVQTACWKIAAHPKYSDSVLCLDTEKSADLQGLLRAFLVNMPATFKCYNKPDGTHACPVTLQGTYKEVQSSLEAAIDRLNKTHRFDDMQGGLYVITDRPTPLVAWISSLEFKGSRYLKLLFSPEINTTFYFTAPSPRSGEADSSVTELSLYEVNLSKPHETLLIYAALTFLFGFAAAVCFYILHRSRIYALQFMREVESVMSISPVAFCHLDESDYICNHNQAFRDLVGYSEQSLHERKLRSLLTRGDSQLRYDVISKYREQMLFTPPYEVQLEGADGNTLNVVISGSPLYMYPRSEESLNQRPHTFGIILKPAEAKRFEYVPLNVSNFEASLKHWAQLARAT